MSSVISQIEIEKAYWELFNSLMSKILPTGQHVGAELADEANPKKAFESGREVGALTVAIMKGGTVELSLFINDLRGLSPRQELADEVAGSRIRKADPGDTMPSP
jgi:hypothetical protein